MGQSSSTTNRQSADGGSSSTTKVSDNNESSWPIVYDPMYNLSLMGFEKFAAFDALRSERISVKLVERGILKKDSFAIPQLPSDEELGKVHTAEYLKSLKQKRTLSSITGIGLMRVMPWSVLTNSILKPFRLQLGGTLLAGKMALEKGWAINLGGGQHHCSHDRSTPGGFSAFADITMNVKFIQENYKDGCKVLVIDLDAHQGNGYARDFKNDNSVFIFDVYNCEIFPHDEEAKTSIKRKVELKSGTKDEEYLKQVRENINSVLDEFVPQYVIYNAGVDILSGDPLGLMHISHDGVIERDFIVFEAVRSRKIPIVMLLSGGFTKQAADVISNSITNLHEKDLVGIPKAESH